MKLFSQLATSVLVPLVISSPVRAEMQAPDAPAIPQIHISVVDREEPSVLAGSTAARGFTILVADASGAPVSDSAVVLRLPDEGPSGSFADNSHSAIVYTSANGLAHIAGIKWNDTPGSIAIKITATKGEARAGMLLSETVAPAKPEAVAAAKEKISPLDTEAPQPKSSAPVQPGTPASAETAGPVRAAAPVNVPRSVPAPPAVSVTSGKTVDSGYHSSHKKWIIVAAVVAAAAGAGIAMGSKGKSSSSTSTSTSGVSVGSPTVSVGQP